MKRSVIAVACTAILTAAILLPLGLGDMFSSDTAPFNQPVELKGVDDASGALHPLPEGDAEAMPSEEQDASSGSIASDSPGAPPVDEPEYVSDVVLVEIADTVSIDEVNAQLAELDYISVDRIDAADVSYGFVELPLTAGVTVDEAIGRMADAEFAVAAQPNYIYHICDESAEEANGADGSSAMDATSAVAMSLQAGTSSDLQDMTAQASAINDPRASSQWALGAVKAYGAWDFARAEHAVTVAILDSGLDMDHPDFKDEKGQSVVVGGYSVLNTDHGNYDDWQGHGTHVAGIIAAGANNGKGVAGVSYNANVMPVQVMDSNSGVNSANAAAGVNYVVEYAAAHPEANVKVINISFGTSANASGTGNSTGDAAFAAALGRAHDAGILVVCAAGNGANSGSGSAYRCYPCDSDEKAIGVISVQASGATYKRADSSNFNMTGTRTKELSAPGVNILSTTFDGDYNTKSGTSMAAPYVSGIAALVFAANPEKTAAEVKQILIDTAQDLNTSANIDGKFDLQTGYGLVDAEAAVKKGSAYMSDGDSLKVGGMLQLSIVNGSGLSCSWASSDSAVATVDSAGKVTGVAAGTSTITARLSNGALLYRTVNVYDPAISGDATIEYGALSTLRVSDSNPSSSWVWSTDDANIVDVGTTSGQIIARGVGQTAITVHLNGSSDIADTVIVTVTKADLANATLSGVDDQIYENKAVTLPNLAVYMADYTQYSFPYYYDTRKLIDGTGIASGDYEVSYANNNAKGTATVTVTAKSSSNYKGSQSKTFSIGDGNIANAAITGTGSYTYTGRPVTVSDLKVVASTGEELTESKDYKVVYPDDHTSAGYVSIEIEGIGKYVGSQTKSFYIAPVSIAGSTVSITGIANKTYTGSAITQSPTLRYNGMTLVEGRDYSISYSTNTNAGTATMRIRGLGNYGTYSGLSPVYRYETFTIAKRAVTITPNSKSKAYDGTALTATAAGYTTSGLVKASDLARVTLGGSITNVGSATATVSGYSFASGMASNYSVTTKTGTLKVTQASLSNATVTLSQTSYTYDGKAKQPGVTVRVGSRTLTSGIDYTVSYSDNVSVGAATATVTGKGNYTGRASASFSISVTRQPLYRLYLPSTGEHHYTLSAYERDACVRNWGWNYEGIAWYCPSTSTTPVFRLYNPSLNLHHYTTSAYERDVCVRNWGWNYEGIAWYSDDAKGAQLYRLYHPASGNHHYTLSAYERDVCVRQWGWRYEGIAWYGLK